MSYQYKLLIGVIVLLIAVPLSALFLIRQTDTGEPLTLADAAAVCVKAFFIAEHGEPERILFFSDTVTEEKQGFFFTGDLVDPAHTPPKRTRVWSRVKWGDLPADQPLRVCDISVLNEPFAAWGDYGTYADDI